jgi:tRNA threonylcarbamoyladenosine biosynthesis protein TsaE
MKSLKLVSHSPEETRNLGLRLGELSQPGDIILLAGTWVSAKPALLRGLPGDWAARIMP